MRNREVTEGSLEAYQTWDGITSKDKLTRSEIAGRWIGRLESAERVYQAWSQRFKVPVLYQYYEGFQHLIENDENNRAYVVNLIYSTIEQKLPNMLFDNPRYTLRPHPFGDSFDLNAAITPTQVKEDTLNYLIGRDEFGFNDAHELAILDAFFGFGVIETDYSKERVYNPSIDSANNNPLDNLYCKQIPFDTFRASGGANWNLTTGKWWGYYEYLPYIQLKKYIKEGKITKPPDDAQGDYMDFASLPVVDGQMVVGEKMMDFPPAGCIKVWKIEDFETGNRIILCPDNAEGGDRLLEVEEFDVSNLSILRYGKRRRGWYPLPPVYQWLCPQDEINDIRQAQAIHRKRFSRKYGVQQGALDPEEKDKFLFGPDGTVITFKKNPKDSLQIIEDGPLDSANNESMQVSYSDMDRVSGATSNVTPAPDRETATAASVTAQRAAVRESKEVTRVGQFMCNVGRNILRTLRKVPNSFWISSVIPEGLMMELKNNNVKWSKVDRTMFKVEDYSVDMALSSISPIYQAEDKKTFLEFLAILSQYEILSISPALIREMAYRVGYKNSQVLNEFQQMAQLTMIGKIAQAKAAANAASNPQGSSAVPNPQLGPQQQLAGAQGSSLENIRNMLFGAQNGQ